MWYSVLRYGKCYYCVCPVCSKYRCPFKHHVLYGCDNCTIGRHECDYFTHYLKTRHFRFKRARSVPVHFGTYILNTHNTVFVGEWDKIHKLAQELGGSPKKLNILDSWLNK